MPPKKRKAAAAATPQAARDVWVLTVESVWNEHNDFDVQLIGCFTNWLDVRAKVEETMEQDPVDLFHELEYCDEIEKEIYHDRLEEEWENTWGLTAACCSGDSNGQVKRSELMVRRTSLQ